MMKIDPESWLTLSRLLDQWLDLPEESRAIEETFANDALSTISAWIVKRSLPQRTGQFQPGAPRHAPVASNPIVDRR